jgi:hypothetical protein
MTGLGPEFAQANLEAFEGYGSIQWMIPDWDCAF